MAPPCARARWLRATEPARPRQVSITMYETPELPEHVNAPERHPLLDFARVFLTVAAVFGGILVAAWWSASWLARQTPFAWEQKLVGDNILGPFDVQTDDGRSFALQALADRLSSQMGLPPEMSIAVHYSDSDVANAFATLGGHVVITQGLLDSVQTENGLAMVLAHEIAHVQHRDPAGSIGGAVAMALLIGFVSGSDADLSSLGANLTQLSFSRAQERSADDAALAALLASYGHTGGAAEFFEHVLESGDDAIGSLIPGFLSTHPHVEDRLEQIRQSQRSGDDDLVTPLPAALGGPEVAAERET